MAMEFAAAATVVLLATIIALPLLLLLLYRSSSKPSTKHPRRTKGGGFLDVIRNSHRFLQWTTDLVAASPTATATTFIGIITANPSNVEHVLKTNFSNYPKGPRSTTTLSDLLGGGIFNADGDAWLVQRKTASLEFSARSLRSFILSAVHFESSARLLPLLRSAAHRSAGAVVDLQVLLDRLAMDNVCRIAFGEDLALLSGHSPTGEAANFATAFEEAIELIVGRFKHPFSITWKLQRLFRLGSELRLKDRIAAVHRFTLEVVRSKKRTGPVGSGEDLLSRFLADSDYPDEFLRDILVSFILAGRDTTSATLAWFFWLISTRSAVRSKIMEEIRSVRNRTGSQPGSGFDLDELRDMVYLHAALAETLRLYPPVPLQPRECTEDDVLPDGTEVSQGQVVMYSSLAMGRSKMIWGEDCMEYRPERWIGPSGEFRAMSPFKFPVFHGGPRMCLGKDMAFIQMKAVATAVMEEFEIEVVDKEKEKEMEHVMILRIKGGLPVRIIKRSI